MWKSGSTILYRKTTVIRFLLSINRNSTTFGSNDNGHLLLVQQQGCVLIVVGDKSKQPVIGFQYYHSRFSLGEGRDGLEWDGMG